MKIPNVHVNISKGDRSFDDSSAFSRELQVQSTIQKFNASWGGYVDKPQLDNQIDASASAERSAPSSAVSLASKMPKQSSQRRLNQVIDSPAPTDTNCIFIPRNVLLT